MKAFEIPEFEVIFFEKKDIIMTSNCPGCHDCGNCEDGKDDCGCFDPWASD